MGLRFLGLLLALLHGLSTGEAADDVAAIQAIRASLRNMPPSWSGSNPCGDKWEGIDCTNSRVTSITLSSMGIKGQLTGDIGTLSELVMLDLSYNKELNGSLPDSIGNLKKLTYLILVGCGFTGTIPPSIGSLQELVFLSLNGNGFSGSIPATIGNLLKLYWLDLADNQLSGTIPISDGTSPGLDMLIYHTKHFHFGKNQLSGTIPPQLFSSNMKLIHVLFDNNQLTGSLPSTLGLVTTLESIRFDRNSLSGPLPGNLNNLTKAHELFLSNNKFAGPLPNLTGLNTLSYLEMSNNSFDASDFPDWITTLPSLTTLMMEQTQLRGPVPTSLFSLPNLETVILRNNALNGTLNIGSTYSSQLQLVDLQSNSIVSYTQNSGGYSKELILVGNPVCRQSGASFCLISQSNSSFSYSTPANNCIPLPCNAADQISSPNCKCSFPYTGILNFRAPTFSDLGNTTHYTLLASHLLATFNKYQLPVDSISISDPRKDSDGYLRMNLEMFPSGKDSFNRTGIYSLGFVLSNQTYKPPPEYGPFVFNGVEYEHFSENIQVSQGSSSSSVSTGVIAGAAAGGVVLLLLLVLAGMYAFRQKKRADKAAETSNILFGTWGSTKSSGSIPQLKGARWFSFEELKKCTNNFSESTDIGSGGYGKVYRGVLPTGQLVAIKRAQQGSMQGGVEFKNEIELLSRVHHKNLVSLVGFCFEQGEQILVYEFIPNGTVKESLTGKSGIRLDWARRLRVALGSARGLQYLHELANPPIIHRDIKSNNILLDERLNARVGDFGLCKLMGPDQKGHVTTQVKGTMGYLDPEYYMTQQLTEKSDVYSFGVFCLELITARRPIERGKYIVKEVRTAMSRSKEMYGLQGIIDPVLASSGSALRGLEKFVDLALWCVAESGTDRPAMGEVVKEIENVMQYAGLNPNAESASTSASYGDDSKGTFRHPYMGDLSYEYSGPFSPLKIEPQ